MKNSIAIIAFFLLISVFGCTLFDRPAENKPEPQKPVEQKEESDEAKELREKIAELEKTRLEEKIKNLEKQIDEVKEAPTAAPAQSPKAAGVAKPPKGFARVNSPGDGFLALRSEPSVNRGVRVNKIPHGKTIRIYECGSRTTVGGRSGRWCQVVYRRDIGWVFDAYLVR